MLKFGVVIPTFNEELDIGETLSALLALSGDVTILVIDDSTDRTWKVVRELANDAIYYARPLYPDGRCGARNLGMQILEPDVDVLVILNADVRLPPFFLERLVDWYRSGADYVCVGSRVSNTDRILGRFTHFQAKYDNVLSKDADWVEWTEGFSMRSSLVEKGALFPAGYPIHICAGEDGVFGQRLRNLGANKIVDFSLVVDHVVPDKIREYCAMRFGRGRGCPQVFFFLLKYPIFIILLRAFGRSLLEVACFLFVLPNLIRSFPIAKLSHVWSDRLFFPFVLGLDKLCFCWGELVSIYEIISIEKSTRGQFWKLSSSALDRHTQ